MKIALSNPGFFFAFFYILSFAVTIALVIVVLGIKRKIPLRSVLLMLTTVSLLIIIGSRLFTIPFTEWGRIISMGSFAEYPGRSTVGGLLFGLVGLIFSQRFLGLGKPIIDLYAWITPIGFGISKIGCFLNGCCYGKPSDLPWSIQYPIGTNAHFHHWVNGMIDKNAAYSLNVQPVQLYEVIFLFFIAYIVWRTQNIWKKNGSILLIFLFLFFIFRFSIEFHRDPASSNFSSNIILGIGVFQWFLLISGIVCGLALLINEKYLRSGIKQSSKSEPSLNKSIIYVLVVSVVIYVFRGLFSPFERISLNIQFIPAILLTAYHVYKSLTIVKFRLATTSFFVFPLFLIAQTFSPDSTKSGSIKDFYQNEVKSYKRVDLGTSLGVYYNSINYNPHEGECGTVYTTEDYKYVYRIAEAGYSTITNKGKSITTRGINFYGGINRENNLTKNWVKTNFLLGVNPYIKYDLNWVGFGFGAHLGNIRWVPGSPIDEPTFNKGTRFSPVLPEVYFRVGRRDILDLKYTYGFNFPTSLPVLMQEYSIGSGFGNKTEFSLRFGAAVSPNNSFPFISAEGLLDKQLGLTFKYDFGNGDFYYSSVNEVEKRKGRILFGANYRFGFKK